MDGHGNLLNASMEALLVDHYLSSFFIIQFVSHGIGLEHNANVYSIIWCVKKITFFVNKCFARIVSVFELHEKNVSQFGDQS